jgi:ABC-type transport system involved in multi-copper enzyme maturation permease subunit
MRAVLERDYLSTAARGRAFVLRALVPAAVAMVAFLVYEDSRSMYQSRPDAAARYVFSGGAVTLLAMLALVTPPAVVGSILDERQRGTLAIVLAAPVRPTTFAAAKLLSRSLAVLTWALAALFPVSLTLLLGGVAGSQVVDLALLTVAVVLELAAWSLWVSSVTSRLATAAVLSYLLPLARWAVTVLLVVLAISPDTRRFELATSQPLRTAYWILGATTPVPGAGRMMDPVQYDRELDRSFLDYSGAGPVALRVNPAGVVTGSRVVPWANPSLKAPPVLRRPAALYLAFSLLAAAAAAWAAGRRLGTESEPRSSAFQRWLRNRRGGRTPPGTGNPVTWKERRLLNTAASRPLYYSVFALMIAAEAAYLVACAVASPSRRDLLDTGLGFAAAHATLLALVAVVGGAAAMAHERSVGTLDLLRGTLLAPGEIVRGKIGGLFRGLLLIGLLPAAHVVLMAATGLVNVPTAALALLLDGVFVLFWGMVGLLCGMTVLRMGAAVGRGAAAFGIAMLGLPLFGGLLEAGFRQHREAEVFLAGWPPATAFFCLESTMRLFDGPWRDAYWWAVDRGHPLNHEHRAALAWATAYSLAAFTFLAVAPAALARRFDREREAGG